MHSEGSGNISLRIFIDGFRILIVMFCKKIVFHVKMFEGTNLERNTVFYEIKTMNQKLRMILSLQIF